MGKSLDSTRQSSQWKVGGISRSKGTVRQSISSSMEWWSGHLAQPVRRQLVGKPIARETHGRPSLTEIHGSTRSERKKANYSVVNWQSRCQPQNTGRKARCYPPSASAVNFQIEGPQQQQHWLEAVVPAALTHYYCPANTPIELSNRGREQNRAESGTSACRRSWLWKGYLQGKLPSSSACGLYLRTRIPTQGNGDISINLMMNEDEDNPSWRSFLTDLDLVIKDQRSRKRGERPARWLSWAVRLLLGEENSFMHELESVFLVLFWICIHYDGPGNDTGPTKFESWNYESDKKLVRLKVGTIGDEVYSSRSRKRSLPPLPATEPMGQ